MLALLALGLTHSLATTTSFELGAMIGGQPYYSVVDTTLDAEAPDAVLGASPYLMGGPRRAILVRFSEIRQALGANRKVISAYLELTPTVKSTAQLSRIDSIQVPWGEGPFPSITSRLVPGSELAIVNWASTWKSRRANLKPTPWQQPGATGPNDAIAIAGAAGKWGETFRIEGLGPAIQTVVDRPWADQGFALRFATEVEFYSNQYPTGRPRLVVESEPATTSSGADLSVRLLKRTGDQWVAEIVNQGDRAVPNFSVEWWIDEKKATTVDSGSPLGPGETRSVTRKTAVPGGVLEPRTRPVEVRVISGIEDVRPENNRVVSYEGAKFIDVQVSGAATPQGYASKEDWAQDLVRRWNEVAADRSRFSADPEGCTVRLGIGSFGTGSSISPDQTELENWRKIGAQLGLGPLEALKLSGAAPKSKYLDIAGISGVGDRRYDGTVPSQVALPVEPEINPVMDLLPPVPYGPLSSVEVAFLNAWQVDPKISLSGFLGSKPRTALLNLQSVGGSPLANVDVRILSVEANGDTREIATQKSGANGSLFIGSRDNAGPFGTLAPDLSNGRWILEATRDGVTDRRWLPVWRLFDLANRGKLPTALLDMKFDLPLGDVERSTDLALNRFVTSSNGLAPNVLGRLVDGTPDSEITLGSKPGDWVEVDLGRDRTIGEVVLVTESATVPKRLDIRTYGTGEKPEDGGLWFVYADLNVLRRDGVKTDGPNAIVLRGPGVQIRYVRIVNINGGNLSLQAIRVHPMRQ